MRAVWLWMMFAGVAEDRGYISLTHPPSATHGPWLEIRQLDL